MKGKKYWKDLSVKTTKTHLFHHQPVLIRFFLVSEGGRMHLIPSAIALTPSLHLARSVASSNLNPIFFIFFSTCFFHVCFGHPRFRGPFTSNIIAFFKMLSSSLLTTCPYHLTPFALAILFKFPSDPAFSSAPQYSFYPLVLLHTLISP